MILLRKKSLSFTLSPSGYSKNSIFYPQFFASASAIQPEPKSNSIADYLITSCGFSPQQAATISNYSAASRFPSDPDSVRHFFKHRGFTDKHIRYIISYSYSILWADVSKILEPNLNAFRKLVDFSDAELRSFIVTNPLVLTSPRALSRLEFWKKFLNYDTKKILLVFTRNPSLLSRDIDKSILPKIALFKNYGLSHTNIQMLLGRGSGIIRRSVSSIEVSLKKIRDLGFPHGSSMFVLALSSIGSTTPDLFEAKIEFFKRLGWSEDMFLDAIKKFPNLILLSDQNIRAKMEFLVGKAGLSEGYIALRPAMLGYSLEKRLMPRYHVWKILSLNEMVGKDRGIYSLMCLPEKKFLKRIVQPYKELVPNLHETYVAACANKISL